MEGALHPPWSGGPTADYSSFYSSFYSCYLFLLFILVIYSCYLFLLFILVIYSCYLFLSPMTLEKVTSHLLGTVSLFALKIEWQNKDVYAAQDLLYGHEGYLCIDCGQYCSVIYGLYSSFLLSKQGPYWILTVLENCESTSLAPLQNSYPKLQGKNISCLLVIIGIC